ncbi:GNAT family N-acetyltransferase [Vibrio sp. S4M6]|uniref:GNAT family N-acetyltransferase n=1 Tax=Vibrio sinus TaxID=2946865 RepID=UPI002029EE5F|nr:GNAT family N-acetyltransferase [Vibrio sinus]MCL9781876.1 GNAT family N-acetyltransferase [Vibrio sinus]
MTKKVLKIHIENPAQCTHFRTLFQEYNSKLSDAAIELMVEQLLALPYFHGFVCYSDNRPAGFAICYESFSTYTGKKVLNIHDFMITLHCRNQKLGQYLLEHIENFCREHDYGKITLEVNEKNTAAQNLYHSCGFSDLSTKNENILHWEKQLIIKNN